eukprot:9694132-Karenia_brevis.AAC.1
MAYCQNCGEKTEACKCENRSRSRERGGSSSADGGVEGLLRKLAADFTKTTEETKGEILNQIKSIQSEVKA